MYEKLVKELRELSHEFYLDDNNKYAEEKLKEAADTIEELQDTVQAQDKALKLCADQLTRRWTPVTERLPDCEQEVLICTEKKLVGKDAYIDSIITPAIYEDGTMRENNSKWIWEDIDYAGWDDEEDCGIIPEGWWENRHFNPDGVYNNPVDRKVVAWMTMPEPYKPPKEECACAGKTVDTERHTET